MLAARDDACTSTPRSRRPHIGGWPREMTKGRSGTHHVLFKQAGAAASASGGILHDLHDLRADRDLLGRVAGGRSWEKAGRLKATFHPPPRPPPRPRAPG